MSAPAAVHLPRMALSLRARNGLLLLALAPGAVLMGARGDAALPLRLAMAIALALALEALALRLRGQALRPLLGEGSAVLAAVLLVLWLPALAGWRLAAAVFVAVIVARQAFGGLGGNVFNPAMAGAAFAQLAFATAPAAPAPDLPLALLWAAGGVALLALRASRWQAPLGLLAGAALALLAPALFGGGAGADALLAAPWWLAAGFVLAEPASSGEHARTRLLCAAFAGALCGLFAAQALAALPFALLAGNALARPLDALFAARARARHP